MSENFRPKVLLIAEAANPQWVSVPLEGWSHGCALAQVADVHIVTQIRNAQAFVEAGMVQGRDFTAIDSQKVARPLGELAYKLRGGQGKGWTTIMAFNALSYYYFERCLYRHFKADLQAGKYDLVHRITPLSPTIPSLLASRCRKLNVPFVMGPLNGGLPWPEGFDHARRKEHEWLSYIRAAYKLLPGYHATRKNAAAIVLGSRETFKQMPTRYHHKCIYIPENAVDPTRFSKHLDRPAALPLKLVFVGRFVPYKGADMLLKAAAPLIRQGKLLVDLVGDGPMAEELKQLAGTLEITSGVTMDGWVQHTQLQNRLMQSDVFAFPSIREFGGAVVLEAMAVGLVPIVMDYGGPGELVCPETGFALKMGPRDQIIAQLQNLLTQLVANPQTLQAMSQRARQRVWESFTWDAKAKQVLEVYRWVLGQRQDKPDFGMPLKTSHAVPVRPSGQQSPSVKPMPPANLAEIPPANLPETPPATPPESPPTSSPTSPPTSSPEISLQKSPNTASELSTEMPPASPPALSDAL